MKIVREHIYEAFRAESDPIADMEIGGIHQIKTWLADQLGEIAIKNGRVIVQPNGIIDVDYSVSFEHIGNFPEYIQFGHVRHDFQITNSPYFNDLRGLPKYVGNDLIIRDVGRSISEKELRDICEVKADVILTDFKTHSKRKSQAKYKRLGPISQRPSPEINDKTPHLHQKYSRGYHLWKMLDYIRKSTENGQGSGRRYKEMVEFDDKYKGLKDKRRTLSMGVFNSLKSYTDRYYRKTYRRYALNQAGHQYLDRYRKYFDDGKDFMNDEKN